jgi:hypothetical protein
MAEAKGSAMLQNATIKMTGLQAARQQKERFENGSHKVNTPLKMECHQLVLSLSYKCLRTLVRLCAHQAFQRSQRQATRVATVAETVSLMTALTDAQKHLKEATKVFERVLVSVSEMRSEDK